MPDGYPAPNSFERLTCAEMSRAPTVADMLGTGFFPEEVGVLWGLADPRPPATNALTIFGGHCDRARRAVPEAMVTNTRGRITAGGRRSYLRQARPELPMPIATHIGSPGVV
jgi:hypothetical protein